MRYKILGLMILVLLTMPTVSAFTTNSTCSGTNTLYEEMELNYYIDGSLDSTEKWNNTVTCRYGCENGKCVNEEISFTAPLVYSIIAFAFGFFAFKLNENHIAIQVLFIFTSLIIFLIASSMVTEFMESSAISSTFQLLGVKGYSILLYVFIAFLTYFFIMLLVNGFNLLSDLTKANMEKKGKR